MRVVLRVVLSACSSSCRLSAFQGRRRRTGRSGARARLSLHGRRPSHVSRVATAPIGRLREAQHPRVNNGELGQERGRSGGGGP